MRTLISKKRKDGKDFKVNFIKVKKKKKRLWHGEKTVQVYKIKLLSVNTNFQQKKKEKKKCEHKLPTFHQFTRLDPFNFIPLQQYQC